MPNYVYDVDINNYRLARNYWGNGTTIYYYDTYYRTYRAATLYIAFNAGFTSNFTADDPTATFNHPEGLWNSAGLNASIYQPGGIYRYVEFPSGAAVSDINLSYIQFTSAGHTATNLQAVTPLVLQNTNKIALQTFKNQYSSASNPMLIRTFETGIDKNYLLSTKFTNDCLASVVERWEVYFRYRDRSDTDHTTASGAAVDVQYNCWGLSAKLVYNANGWTGTVPASRWCFDRRGLLAENFPVTNQKTNCDGETIPAEFKFWTDEAHKSTAPESIPENSSFPVGQPIPVTSTTNVYAICEYPKATINFHGNGATGGQQASVYPTVRSSSESAYRLPTTTGYTRTGYSFAGWYTQATGGTRVTTMASGIGNKTYDFYAHWTANTYVVTFNKQSGAGGSDNVSIIYETTSPLPTVTVPTRSGYSFGGYYTETNGGGTQRVRPDGSWVNTTNTTFTAPTTLYALWYVPSQAYDVTYYKGVADTGAVPPVQKKINGVPLILEYNHEYTRNPTVAITKTVTVTYNPHEGVCPISTDKAITRATTTYTANGWATTSTGAKAYNFGGSYTTNAALSLYPSFATSTTSATNTLILPTPTRTGFTFNGWYTRATGGTKIGNAGAEYNPTRNITLHAQWTELTYTITYKDGTSTITDTKYYTKVYSMKPGDTFAKFGYKFVSWNTNAAGTGTSYGAGASYATNAPLTVFAIWEQLPPEAVYIIYDPASNPPRVTWDAGTNAVPRSIRI